MDLHSETLGGHGAALAGCGRVLAMARDWLIETGRLAEGIRVSPRGRSRSSLDKRAVCGDRARIEADTTADAGASGDRRGCRDGGVDRGRGTPRSEVAGKASRSVR